jgi:nitrite reductase/ring-hydroxylating ferredoxin subunit/Fe-S cluster biogenesis protein NfuA
MSTGPSLAPTESLPPDLDALLKDIETMEEIASGWDETQIRVLKAHGLALEALNKEALRRLIAAVRAEPAAVAALREAAADPIVYSVLRRHGLIKASLVERVDAALESVRPMLASHGGGVDLISVVPPNAIEVKFTGACDSCAASAMTFHAGVKKAVEDHCPEITEIRQVKGLSTGGEGAVNFVSPFAGGSHGTWHLACRLTDLDENAVRKVTLAERSILLARVGDVVAAYENACAHLSLPIDDGDVEDGIITCPYHGFQYLLATGECITAKEVQLQPYAVRVIGSRVEVRITV